MTRPHAYEFQSLDEAKSFVLERLMFQLDMSSIALPDWYLMQLRTLIQEDAYSGRPLLRNSEEKEWDNRVNAALEQEQRRLKQHSKLEWDKFTEAIAYLRDDGYYLGVLGARSIERFWNKMSILILVLVPLVTFAGLPMSLGQPVRGLMFLLLALSWLVWLFVLIGNYLVLKRVLQVRMTKR